MDGTRKEPERYQLYDLAPGGMGFIVNDPGVFQKGDMVAVKALNKTTLDPELTGDIVSIKQMHECLDQFKIGVKFDKF